MGRTALGTCGDDDGWLYYLDDAAGYVRQGTDDQGVVVSAWTFDPDGLVLEGPVSHLVCGGIYDWSTGLIYKERRYFDPTLGIWLALMPLVVVQSWRGRKRKKRWWHPWYVVVVILASVSGMLMGCDVGTVTIQEVTKEICILAPTGTPGAPSATPMPTGTFTPAPTSVSMPPTPLLPTPPPTPPPPTRTPIPS